LSKDNVNDLIAQMRTAVQNAKGTTTALNSAMSPKSVAPAAASAAAPVSNQVRSDTAMQLEIVNQLMLGVETRFGIKPGTLVERKLVRILKEMPISVLRDWVNSMNIQSGNRWWRT
jgi:chemotaxis protein methyltransferase CheR